jgi:predicted oxidoreductase
MVPEPIMAEVTLVGRGIAGLTASIASAEAGAAVLLLKAQRQFVITGSAVRSYSAHGGRGHE